MKHGLNTSIIKIDLKRVPIHTVVLLFMIVFFLLTNINGENINFIHKWLYNFIQIYDTTTISKDCFYNVINGSSTK